MAEIKEFNFPPRGKDAPVVGQITIAAQSYDVLRVGEMSRAYLSRDLDRCRSGNLKAVLDFIERSLTKDSAARLVAAVATVTEAQFLQAFEDILALVGTQ